MHTKPYSPAYAPLREYETKTRIPDGTQGSRLLWAPEMGIMSPGGAAVWPL